MPFGGRRSSISTFSDNTILEDNDAGYQLLPKFLPGSRRERNIASCRNWTVALHGLFTLVNLIWLVALISYIRETPKDRKNMVYCKSEKKGPLETL
jgi:hypothetical protein